MQRVNLSGKAGLQAYEANIKKERYNFYTNVDIACQSYSRISVIWIHLKRALRSMLAKYPRLFSLIYGLRPKYRGTVVSKKTEIVIEGYPRSGNTYAVAALCYAQHKNIVIARHQHSVAQVLFAVKYDIPCVVIIRNPKDAIFSYLIREPSMTLHEAVFLYTKYYSTLDLYKDNFVIAHFEDVIQDFNTIIRRVNDKYDCRFNEYCLNEQSKVAIFSSVKEMERIDSCSTEIRTTHVALPDRKRSEFADFLDTITTHDCFKEAEKIYHRFIQNDPCEKR